MTDRGQAAWEYHERTKHSPASVRASRHVLDWEIQPIPYKLYEGLEPLALPRALPAAAMPALDAIASPGAPAPATAPAVVPDLAALGRLLHLAAGIVRKAVYPGGREVYFRAAACTGALYHVDLYVVTGALADLAPGVYHFGPHDFALRLLRAGDHRAHLVAAAADDGLAEAPVVLVSTSTFWRNAWKYQARTYRHCFWDDGTILANLLAAAAAGGLPARVVAGFVDGTVGALLGLETAREVALTLTAIGHAPDRRPGTAPALEPLACATAPLSTREVDYPAIHAAHAASSLASPEAVRAWRERAPAAARESPPPSHVPAPAAVLPKPTTVLLAPAAVLPAPAGATIPLRPLAAPPATPLDAVIRRRGSTRQFAREPISLTELSTILVAATGGIPADFLRPAGAHLSDPYLIVHAVDGLAPGAYVLHRAARALECLRAGDFRREAGFLGLGQELPADAAVNVYLLADLRRVLGALGDRGYRAAQLEAAVTGGRIYLAAYALGLGATGLTFFDDEVTTFFSPHAAGKSVLFLMALGHGRRRAATA